MRLTVISAVLFVVRFSSLAIPGQEGDGSNWGRIPEVYVGAKGSVP